jgi:Tetratricopeptide repeat
MRSAFLSLVALALISGSTAHAQGIHWAKSFDEAVKEAKERGVLILCVLTMNGEGSNEQMQGLYANNPALKKACGKFVCVFANKDLHQQLRKKIDGVEQPICQVCGNIPCKVHQDLAQVLVRLYGDVMIDPTGGVRTPVQWLVDGEKDLVEIIAAGTRETGFDVLSAAELISRLKAAAKKYGPGLSADQYHKLKSLLTEGETLEKAGSYAAAAAKYNEIIKVAPKKVGAVETAQANLKRIAVIGEKNIAEAEVLVKGEKYAEAMDLLKKVTKEFKGSPAEKRAKEVLAQMKKNPAVARLIQASAASAGAGKILAQAEAAERKKAWKKALEAYRSCAKQYPGTEAGKKAQAKVAEFESSDEIMGKIRGAAAAKDCGGWLNLAKNFISNNVPERAKVYLRKVIDNYPGTTYAREAQELLDGLK